MLEERLGFVAFFVCVNLFGIRCFFFFFFLWNSARVDEELKVSE